MGGYYFSLNQRHFLFYRKTTLDFIEIKTTTRSVTMRHTPHTPFQVSVGNERDSSMKTLTEL
jgi:hypothetical protein